MSACGRCGQVHDPARCVGHVKLEGGGLRPCKQPPRRGGTVCNAHGGRAPQVRAKAAARLAMAEALARSPRRHPGEVLADAVHALDVLEQRTRLRLGADASPEQVAAWASEVRAAASLAKTALDAQVDDRRVRLEEEKGALLASGLRWLLGVFGVADDPRAIRAVAHMLRELEAGRLPQGNGHRVPVNLDRALPSTEQTGEAQR